MAYEQNFGEGWSLMAVNAGNSPRCRKIFQKDGNTVCPWTPSRFRRRPGDGHLPRPLGCGKTTTTPDGRGVRNPVGRTISIAGEDVTNVPVNRLDIGLVFQNYGYSSRTCALRKCGLRPAREGLSEAGHQEEGPADGLELVGESGRPRGASRTSHFPGG
jgi:hypothetical protein